VFCIRSTYITVVFKFLFYVILKFIQKRNSKILICVIKTQKNLLSVASAACPFDSVDSGMWVELNVFFMFAFSFFAFYKAMIAFAK
jgi:hypothetical protein